MPFISLSNAALYILLTLSRGERHGYAIMKEVAELSQENITLGPATLYTTLKRLLQDGLIEETEEGRDSASAHPGERRRYYKLSEKGVEVVKAELLRMDSLVRKFTERAA